LQQALLVHKPQIVHISGHGTSGGEIVLEDGMGRPKPVSKKALVELFRTLKDNVRVVLFNAPFTRPQTEAIARNIDFVIGMNRAISKEAAIVFAASFYRGIAFGRSLQEAFDLARGSLLLAGMEGDIPRLKASRGLKASEEVLIASPTRLVGDVTSPEEVLPELVRAAVTAVDMVRCIGAVVERGGYDRDRAARACKEYSERYEKRHAKVKVLGMAEPIELASIYTEVRVVPPSFLRGYMSRDELQESFLREGRYHFHYHGNTPNRLSGNFSL
jgi:hypothetical protein